MQYDEIDTINLYITDRIAKGYIVFYNHPYRSLQTFKDYSKLKGCFVMEIYSMK